MDKPALTTAALSLAAAIACTGAAAAAEPAPKAAPTTAVEGVTVQAPSQKTLDKQVRDFVAASDAQSRIGQLPRWEDRICPRTIGLPPDFAGFVNKRILTIAAEVKAPVAKDPAKCQVNLLIVVTGEPQALLDKVLKERPYLLGFHYTRSEAEALAKVTHPIQAWYATATQDLNGRVIPDDPEADWQATSDPDEIVANATHAEGSRLRSGLKSQFSSVLVVVDSAKIAAHGIGALSDYIAMLALTQSQNLDSCRALPTISNLFTAGCATAAVTEVTPVDLAYLKGLYEMGGTNFGALQQSAIAWEIKKALKAK